MLRSGKVWQIWRFAIFRSISLPLSRNLTPSLSYHIVRKRIAKVTDFFSFCPFRISKFPFLTIGISMYQKRILYFTLFYYSLLIYPKLILFWSVTDGQISTPLSPLLLFFSTESAGPYPQAQLYWAGRTMGWMADWTRDMYFRMYQWAMLPHTAYPSKVTQN